MRDIMASPNAPSDAPFDKIITVQSFETDGKLSYCEAMLVVAFR